jgi:hypothetical protein
MYTKEKKKETLHIKKDDIHVDMNKRRERERKRKTVSYIIK